jgi:hypothetical protein
MLDAVRRGVKMAKARPWEEFILLTQRDRQKDESDMGALRGLHRVGAKSRGGVTGVVQRGRVVWVACNDSEVADNAAANLVHSGRE